MSDPSAPERVPHEDPSQKAAIGRKVYRRPELTTYGSVAHVIRGAAAMMNGDFTGAATKMCWIAEALYGADAPRTRLIRAWLTDRYAAGVVWARILVPVYAHCGRLVARGVRSSVLVRRACALLFDGAVHRAHDYYARSIVDSARTSISPSA